jgi:hypothetical protein
MSRKVSERWKRRVGSRHWTEDEDEFVRYIPPDDVNDHVFAVLVKETEHDPSTTIDSSFMQRVLFLGLPSILAAVLLFVEKRRRKIPTPESAQPRRRRKQTRADITTAVTTKRCYEIQVDTCDDFELVNQDEGTKADAIVVQDDKEVNVSAHCLDSKSDTDFTLPVNELQESHQHATLVNITVNTDTLLLPGLVVEEVGALATNKTTSCPVLSDSLELTVPDDNNNRSSCSFDSLSLLPCKKTEQGTIEPAALVQDAQIVAQSIRLTQAVFEQHGLDSRIATEWAMRRQESELSVRETE